MNHIDRIEQLRADLARVTAERDQLQSIAEKRYEEFRREANAHFVAAGEIEKLETRCGELVAALRDAVGMLEELDGLDWGEEGMPFDVDFNHFAKVLARAESATPLPMREDPRYRGTDFRSAIDVDRASQGGGK